MNAVFAAMAAGAALSLQALVNARLGRALGGPVWASMVSLQIGALVLLAIQVATRAVAPTGAQVASIPPWAWGGGLLGACYLTGALFSVSSLGAASMVSLVVFGQMTGAILLDHSGVLAEHAHALSLGRIAGAGLVLAGVLLITRS